MILYTKTDVIIYQDNAPLAKLPTKKEKKKKELVTDFHCAIWLCCLFLSH